MIRNYLINTLFVIGIIFAVVYVLSMPPSRAVSNFDITSGLAAFYPINGNANDESGNGNDGSPMGGPLLTADRFGNSDSAGMLDGVDDYIYLDDLLTGERALYDFPVAVRTVSLWYNANDVIGPYVLYDEGGAFNGLNIYIENSEVFAGAWSGSGAWLGDWLNVPTDPGFWHHVAFVLDSYNSKIKLYYDGDFISEKPVATYVGEHFADDAIGAMILDTKFISGDQTGDGFYFDGIIDDIYIYNYALSDSEISQLYSFISNTPTPFPSPGFSATPPVNSSGTPSTTPSSTPAGTPTATPSATPSPTPSPTPSATSTPTPTSYDLSGLWDQFVVSQIGLNRTVKVIFTVNDSGTASYSGQVDVDFYYSVNTSLDSSDTLQAQSTGTMSGASFSTSLEFVYNGFNAIYLIADIDPDNIVPESDELNNVSVSPIIK